MVVMAARNTPALGTKKARKAYTISRPREKWSADEHDRFVHALLVFGRDWKTIEQFVGTKTATQIRSHAQKHFLKAHKLGLAAVLPPPHPRRATVVAGLMAPAPPPPPPAAVAQQQSVDWASRTDPAGACWSNHGDLFMMAPNGSDAAPSREDWFAGGCFMKDGTSRLLPMSPDDPRFAEVYAFVGDVFGSGAPQSVEAQMQRLIGADPAVAETILVVLRNLQDNLCG